MGFQPNTADIITSLRILIIPFLIISELRSLFVLSFIFICFATLTDISDGMVARVQIKKSSHGAIYDVSADFLIIITAYILLVSRQGFPLIIIPLLLISFLSYSIYSIIKKKLIKNSIGQFTGAVCFAGIIVIFFLRIFFIDLLSSLKFFIIGIVCLYLLIATTENLILIIHHYLRNNHRLRK